MAKPEGISQKYYEYLQECGWDENDIQRIALEVQTMKKHMEKNRVAQQSPTYQPRDVTCSNYERAQGRLFKEVDGWLTGKAGLRR